MAKKRKLRSSEPETSKAPEPQPQEQQQPPPLQTEVVGDEGDDLNHQQMAVDDSNQGEPEQQQDDEKNQSETLDAAAPQNGGVSVEANGGGNEEEDEEEEDEEDEEEEEEEEVEEEEDDEEPVEKLLEPFSREQLLSLVKQAAEKYPDFISNIRDLAEADPAHRKIFVHGLGWDTTAETLISEFVKYGEIEDCKAVTDRVSGKSKGYAFILFKRRSGARKALKQPQKKIGNRITSSQLASAGPVPAPPPVAAPVSEYTLRKIFVSNVSTEVDPAKLLEFFRQFGEIEEGPLGLDRQTGRPKGFALFVYKSVESAKKALEEPHKSFEGLTLHCQKAIDGPKVNKPYHHHQQHHHHHHHQPHQPQQQFHSRKDKNKYSAGPGHLMAPSGPAPAAMGFNPGVPAGAGGPPPLNPVLGQALTALLTTQGAGLGIGNLLGGLSGAPINQAGPPAGYGNQAAGGYGNQPGMQGGYQNPQMGQSGARPHGPGAPYMGH